MKSKLACVSRSFPPKLLPFWLAQTLLLAPLVAWAQNPGNWPYHSVPGTTDRGQVQALRGQARAILASPGAPSQQALKQLQDYYLECVLKPMTMQQTTLDGRWFSVVRAHVAYELGVLCRNAAAHDHVVNLIFPLATQLAKGNYHPACRYNAMLLIGDLNRQEQSPVTPPHPHPEARSFLLAQLRAPDTPDALRVAALVGLKRHARLSRVVTMDDQDKKNMESAFLAAAGQKRAPPGRTEEAHAWIRRLAVEGVAALGDPVAAKTVIEPILSDPAEATALRCAAAAALADLNYGQTQPQWDYPTLTRGLGQTVVDVCRTELTRLNNELTRARERGASADLMVEPDVQHRASSSLIEPSTGPPQIPEDARVTQSRRQLLYQLGCIEKGIAALSPLTQDAQHQTALRGVKSVLDELLLQVKQRLGGITLEQFVQRIEPPTTRLEQALKTS